MIRIDALSLCTQAQQEMRAGADGLLTVVVNTIGDARAHHGYLFANARAGRIKLLVHDGSGVWCATRRLHAGRFVWHAREPGSAAPALQLSAQQFEALGSGCRGSAWANSVPSAAADALTAQVPMAVQCRMRHHAAHARGGFELLRHRRRLTWKR